MSSYPTWDREFPKNNKKIQKIKQHHYGYFSSQNKLERPRKIENIKKNHSDEFLHDPGQRIPKKQHKNSKN